MPDRVRRLILAAMAGLLVGGFAQAQTPDSALDLAKYRGKVVYVDFWASWCGPCQLSFPYMDRLAKRYPASDFVLIAVNVDHERAKADAFLKRYGGAVPVLFDAAGKIAAQFGVKDMPTSMLIGRDGRTRFVHKGFFEAQTAQYEAHIQELIHEK